MDEEIQIEGAQSLGDNFCEKNEAPKFVDLTAPNRHRSSTEDRCWFFLRVVTISMKKKWVLKRSTRILFFGLNCKAEIKRLQESEAEIKALSVN